MFSSHMNPDSESETALRARRGSVLRLWTRLRRLTGNVEQFSQIRIG